MNFTLSFEFQSYWHVGDGNEAGAYAAQLVRKDRGLPFIPGRSLCGMLRTAFTTAERNHWFDSSNETATGDITAILFGAGGKNGTFDQSLIELTNAYLAPAEQQFFAAEPTAIAQLYKVISATAIDSVTGVAKDSSLRRMEVTIPVTLYATLCLNEDHPKYTNFIHQYGAKFPQWLSQTLSLISELGAKSHRGLGKVLVHSTPTGQE